jgi:AcrR family transcriptional regulator
VTVATTGATRARGPSFAKQSRVQLRSATLNAMLGAITSGSSTSMSSVAARVGVSRQTLYNEFGSRDALLAALIAREDEAIVAEVAQALQRHPHDLPGGVAETVELLLGRCAEHPLTKALLGGDPDLLPRYPTRAEPLLERSAAAMRSYARARFPGIAAPDVALLIEVVVRLVHSHIVVPRESPAVVAARVARLVERFIPGSAGPG